LDLKRLESNLFYEQPVENTGVFDTSQAGCREFDSRRPLQDFNGLGGLAAFRFGAF
jgi:hypothetical protein